MSSDHWKEMNQDKAISTMIPLQNPGADIFVPDGLPIAEAARQLNALPLVVFGPLRRD